MGKDSKETSDHDIWLLSEEYQYFDYISSDKALSSITWDGAKRLFQADVDASLKAIFAKHSADNARKRPDIAIFSEEGSAIIIEFKSPAVSLDDHVADLMEYSQLLAAKSEGRLKKFYGYLIGTEINENRLIAYTRFPSGRGWFSTQPVREHSTGNILGELYSEILYYQDICERAHARLQVYKERLNVSL